MTLERLARQEIQSRFFSVGQPDRLIRAAINVIQDQHYTIRETNVVAGMIFADQTNEFAAPFRLFGFWEQSRYPLCATPSGDDFCSNLSHCR